MLMFLIPFSVCIVCGDARVLTYAAASRHNSHPHNITDTYGQMAGGNHDASIFTEGAGGAHIK